MPAPSLPDRQNDHPAHGPRDPCDQRRIDSWRRSWLRVFASKGQEQPRSPVTPREGRCWLFPSRVDSGRSANQEYDERRGLISRDVFEKFVTRLCRMRRLPAGAPGPPEAVFLVLRKEENRPARTAAGTTGGGDTKRAELKRGRGVGGSAARHLPDQPLPRIPTDKTRKLNTWGCVPRAVLPSRPTHESSRVLFLSDTAGRGWGSVARG